MPVKACLNVTSGYISLGYERGKINKVHLLRNYMQALKLTFWKYPFLY